MKISTAVLLAGVSAAVGVAQLVQTDRQHKQRNDLALSLVQIDWLSRASTDGKEAAHWSPDGMDAEQYQALMSANRMLCQLSLRYRLGLATGRQLALYADKLMDNADCRDYWKQFGAYREAEALGNKIDERFTRAVSDAFNRAMSLAA